MPTTVYTSNSRHLTYYPYDDFRNLVFCVGMENSGSKLLYQMIADNYKGEKFCLHESPPFLAKEAKLRFNNQEWETYDLRSKIRFFLSPSHKHKLIFESNHRFAFFIDYIFEKTNKRSKFIWLVRNPYDYIISKICTFRYCPSQYNRYDKYYRSAIYKNNLELESLSQINKREINDFRIEPENINEIDLIEFHLWEWIETFKFTKKMINDIPSENYLIIRSELLFSKYLEIFKFINNDCDNYFNKENVLKYLLRIMEPKKIYSNKKIDEMRTHITESTCDLLASLKT